MLFDRGSGDQVYYCPSHTVDPENATTLAQLTSAPELVLRHNTVHGYHFAAHSDQLRPYLVVAWGHLIATSLTYPAQAISIDMTLHPDRYKYYRTRKKKKQEQRKKGEEKERR